jgi:peptidyl-tRNA hydrolase, PTH1 family
MAVAPSHLIVGLGNPGSKFAGTRHNAGFLLLDRLVDRWHATPLEGGGNFLLWSASGPSAETVFLMKPLTYMNLSGEAVSVFLERHPLDLEHILVAYDDIALPVGRIRLRANGSAGGQKGIAHIMAVLGHDEVPRLRLGIDSAFRQGRPLPDFVLETFADEEAQLVSTALERGLEAVEFWLAQGMALAMARFNAAAP